MAQRSGSGPRAGASDTTGLLAPGGRGYAVVLPLGLPAGRARALALHRGSADHDRRWADGSRAPMTSGRDRRARSWALPHAQQCPESPHFEGLPRWTTLLAIGWSDHGRHPWTSRPSSRRALWPLMSRNRRQPVACPAVPGPSAEAPSRDVPPTRSGRVVEQLVELIRGQPAAQRSSRARHIRRVSGPMGVRADACRTASRCATFWMPSSSPVTRASRAARGEVSMTSRRPNMAAGLEVAAGREFHDDRPESAQTNDVELRVDIPYVQPERFREHRNAVRQGVGQTGWRRFVVGHHSAGYGHPGSRYQIGGVVRCAATRSVAVDTGGGPCSRGSRARLSAVQGHFDAFAFTAAR